MAENYTVVRRTTIAAPAADIHAHIHDLHRWVDWSPWEGLDPDLSRTYSGAELGVGARYAWSGNRKAGKGTMEILEDTAPTHVAIRVVFEKPMKSTSRSAFDITENDGVSDVTWTMTGKHSLFSRVAAPLGFFDKLLGKDFEKDSRGSRPSANRDRTGCTRAAVVALSHQPRCDNVFHLLRSECTIITGHDAVCRTA